jgi:uncharacterized protein (DUF934 family)
MKLIAAHAQPTETTGQNFIELANDADPRELALAGVDRVDLNFPKFSGDVLADQLAQMERSGFTTAVLRADQDLALAQRVLSSYPGYGVGRYQGDAVQVNPHFAA